MTSAANHFFGKEEAIELYRDRTDHGDRDEWDEESYTGAMGFGLDSWAAWPAPFATAALRAAIRQMRLRLGHVEWAWQPVL